MSQTRRLVAILAADAADHDDLHGLTPLLMTAAPQSSQGAC